MHLLRHNEEQGLRPLIDERRARWLIPTVAAGLYFAQGFPFGIATETFGTYLSVSGISAEKVGLASTIGLAWTLKVFWAPLVDLYGSYRAWIMGGLACIAITLVVLGVVPPATNAFWIAASILALASATQDIAIDALAIRITPSKLLGPVNSIRVAAYRSAMIVAGGLLALFSDWMGWRAAFFAAAAICVVLILIVMTIRGEGEGERVRHENPFRSLGKWLSRPRAILLLVVILLYKVGDSAVIPMIKKYWATRGFSAGEIGTVTTTLGMICVIAGAFAGGAFVARYGIYRGLLWLGLAQMLSNIAYAMVATTTASRPWMYGASIVENFTGGLGTAAFLSFLMFICDRENAATEYAMLTAIFGLSRTLAQMVSGYGVTYLGFAEYFWFTVLLGMPGLLLLPSIREAVRGDARSVARDATAET